MTDELKTLVEEVKSDFETKIKDAEQNKVTQEMYNAFKDEVKTKLDGLNIAEELKEEINRKHAELAEKLEAQGLEIKRLVTDSNSMNDAEKKEFSLLTRKNQLKVLLDKSFDTDEFKAFTDSNGKRPTPRMDIKAVTGLTADHTGDIFVTEPIDNIRDIPRMQPHMRDYLSVSQTDETKITFPEITDYTDIYTLGTQMLSENEEVTDVSFKSKENTSNVVRLGVSMNVSKRYFRGRSSSIVNHVVQQLADGLSFKEDVQILHGTGAGNNLSGISVDARKFDLTPTTFVAGNISSVADYNTSQALITFAVPHGLLSGDSLTIADATATTYNATHKDIILIDETSVVINLTYVAEADTSAWTGSGLSYWYQSVEAAQEFDVLSAASSILEAGLYSANLAFVNPQTTKRLGTLKGTDAHYIGVSRDAAGRLNLDGMPIVSIPTIPAGWFLIGDFSAKNLELKEYTSLSIQFLEDVTTNKQNAVVILADEEIHLVKFNPKWYIYDRFSTAKTQLETP